MKTVVTAIMIALFSLVGFNNANAQVHARVRVGVPVPGGRVVIHAGAPAHHYYYHHGYYGHPYYGYRRAYDNRVWVQGYWNAYGYWVPGHYSWR